MDSSSSSEERHPTPSRPEDPSTAPPLEHLGSAFRQVSNESMIFKESPKDDDHQRSSSSRQVEEDSEAEFQAQLRALQLEAEKRLIETSMLSRIHPSPGIFAARIPRGAISKRQVSVPLRSGIPHRSRALPPTDSPVRQPDGTRHPSRSPDWYERRGSGRGYDGLSLSTTTVITNSSDTGRSFDESFDDPFNEQFTKKRGPEDSYESTQRRRQYRRSETESEIDARRSMGNAHRRYHSEEPGLRHSSHRDADDRNRRDSHYPPVQRAPDYDWTRPRRISDAGSSSRGVPADRWHSGHNYGRSPPVFRGNQGYAEGGASSSNLYSDEKFSDVHDSSDREESWDPRSMSPPPAYHSNKPDKVDLNPIEKVRETFVKNEQMNEAVEAGATSKSKRRSPNVPPTTEGKRVFDDFDDDCFTEFVDVPSFIAAAHGPVNPKELDDLLGDLNELFQEEPKMETRVKDTHAAIAALWPKGGSEVPELAGVESSLLAHKYYEAWAPRSDKPVNLLVLSESPIFTDPSIVGAYVDDIDVVHLGHLNLVHCLSYGESWMLPKKRLSQLDAGKRRSVDTGSKQVWRLLSTLAGEHDGVEGPDPLLVDSMEGVREVFSHLENSSGRKKEWSVMRLSRVDAKLRVLNAMRDRGIMLADVSPVPLSSVAGAEPFQRKKLGPEYLPKTDRLPDTDYNAILKTAWEKYAKHMIRTHRPKNILVLGVKVENTIGASALEEAANEVGGTYLGRMHHPGYGKIQGRSFLPALRVIRHIAQSAARGEPVVLSPH